MAPTPRPPGATVTTPTGAVTTTTPTWDETKAKQVQPADAAHAQRAAPDPRRPDGPSRTGKVRVRRTRRVLRRIEPMSALKLSLGFYSALFLIICVASSVLWVGARATGVVDNLESFVTSVGGFGNCEPVDGAAPTTTTTTQVTTEPDGPVDQLDPSESTTTVPDPGEPGAATPGDEGDCREGERLVGEFKFQDGRILLAVLLAGIVLVLAGSAANLVLVVLFNMMSEITGGLRMTVLEEEPPPPTKAASGSPAPRPGD